ncbi:MAG TPA: hypothetical protein VKQ06_05535, partial [Gammaproteobacteria bacterium]|nr:hypothetical protein [Gammaproteobacteria bacterium]
MIRSIDPLVALAITFSAAGLAAAQSPAPTSSLTYDVLYAGADGESHFRDGGSLELILPAADERADGDMYFHTLEGVTSVMLTRLTAGMIEDWHASPQRMFVYGLQGEVEMTASDGTTRIVRPGEMLLLEDTSGKGHLTRVPGDADYVGLGVLIDNAFEGNAPIEGSPSVDSSRASLPPDIDSVSYSRLPLILKDSLDEEGRRIFAVINGDDADVA